MNRTFWSVAEEYRIEIPLLQRDYAQGRLDPRAVQVRVDLVADCHDALSADDAPPLELGLVYGAIHPEAGGGKRLVLLDGQQRVTTLYLLHWYLGRRGAASESIHATLARFSYETRVTTREFCAALAVESFTINASRPLSKQIENTPWFFQAWKRDPTIAGMLVMLDVIHEAFDAAPDAAGQQPDFPLLWRRLIREAGPGIIFRFLDMPDFELIDELYIKMNARGRPLSEFEKFKAWLESAAERFDLNAPSADGQPPRPWTEEMDKEWTDFFWKLAGKKTTETDVMFLRCLHSIALNYAVVALANLNWAANRDRGPQNTTDRINEFIEEVIADDFLSTKVRECLYEEATLREIFHVMRRLCADVLLRTNETELFQKVCESHQLIYKERVAFHTWCRALGGEAEPGNPTAIKRWQHVVWHLLSNSTVERSEEYARVLCSIHAIGREASADPDRFFAEKKPALVGFDPEHMAETIRKAKIIRKNPANSELARKWQAALEDADNHPYFAGRIHFLLELASADVATSESLASFIRYTAVARRIFDEKNGLIERPDFLLQRALLAKDDGIVHYGRNRNLGRYRYNLRTYMFRWPDQIERLRLVLSGLEPGLEEAGLKAIIEQSQVDDWRRFFIDCPDAIGRCGEGNTRWQNTRDDADDWLKGRNIRLLAGANITGRFYELRSYCLYSKHLESKAIDYAPLVPDYHWQHKGSLELPYAFLKSDNARCRIEVRYLPMEPEATAYEIQLRTTNGTPLPASIAEQADLVCAQSAPLHGGTGIGWYYPGENEAVEGLRRVVSFSASTSFEDV